MENIAKLGNGIYAHTSSQKHPHGGLQSLGQHPLQDSLLYDKLEMEQWQLSPVKGALCHPSETKDISVRMSESHQHISCLLQKFTWLGRIVLDWPLEILWAACSSQVLWQHRVPLRRMKHHHDAVIVGRWRLILDSKFILWEKLTMLFFPPSPPLLFSVACLPRLVEGKKGVKVENRPFLSKLIFFNVSEHDYGNYTCVASNKLGHTNASIMLFGETLPGAG